jgi:septin family protein
MNQNNTKIQYLTDQNEQLVQTNLQYQQILEKTNSQLGLWSNPYGLMVGALSFLVAFLAVAATVFTLWQNNKNKKMVREELEKLFNEKQESSLELIKKTTEDSEEKLKTASGQQKAELENKIKDLKNLELQVKAGVPDFSQYMKKDDYLCEDCKNLDKYGLMSWRLGVHSTSLFMQENRKCVSCGKNF